MKKMSKSDNQPDSTQRLLAICGIIGPIVYAIIVIILGFLHPDYNHVTQYMSELGAVGAPYAIIMDTVGLPLLGLLMIFFAFGLHRGIGEDKGAKIGPTLVAVSGTALVMTGIFPCDPGCADVTFVGNMHSVFATIAGFAMLLAPIAISPRLRNDYRWQGYLVYSLATVVVAGIISAVFGLMIFEAWTRALEGALQRISMGLLLLWIDVMAIRLLRLSF